jgi:hypothetical protein
MKKILISFILALGLAQLVSAQDKWTSFKSEKFTIKHPPEWKHEKEDDIYSFYPEENFAAVTISWFANEFKLDDFRQFILETLESTEKPESVKMTKKDNMVRYDYEYTGDETKWILRMFTTEKDIYLVTINCEEKKWDSSNKAVFMKVIETFSFKGQ